MQSDQKHAPSREILTIAQVAQELQLSRAEVYRLVYAEGLPVMRFGRVSRVMRVRREALQRWLQQREEKTI